MKIQKKFAVTLFDFVAEYLENGYYPVDDSVDESAILSKTLGFGLHHDLAEAEWVDDWCYRRELPKAKKVARIDLTYLEMSAILDMMGESVGKDIETKPAYHTLEKYLKKEVLSDEHDTEDSKGE